MSITRSDTATRIRGAASAAGVQILLTILLLDGLSLAIQHPPHHDVALFNLVTVPPPAPLAIDHPRAKTRKANGAASPPNLKAKPTEITAPPPLSPPPVQRVVVAPKAGAGPDPSAGASNRPGPGTGAGGVGTGTGSGNAGEGPGDGGGTPLQWLSGRIKDSDYPDGALKRGIGGTVQLRFTVGVKGRVTDCTITRSSGDAELDATTCRLIVKRFRYKPTRDAQGHAVPDVVTGEHVWEIYRPDPSADEPGT